MTKPTKSPSAGHISAEDIAAFLARRTMSHERKKIMAHLEQCSYCRTLAVQVVLSEATAPDPDDDSD
jgi:hypothetical protein